MLEKIQPTFRTLFSNYGTVRKQSINPTKEDEYGRIQNIKLDLERAKNVIDNLHNQKSHLKKTL